MKPSIGRIVLAVIHDGNGELITRPAIITRTWGEESTSVRATVFPDVWNDRLPEVAVGKSSLAFDEAGQAVNSWHWPPQPSPTVKKGADDEVSVKISFLRKLLKEQRELCFNIESLPASPTATVLSTMASTVGHNLQSIFLDAGLNP